MTDTNVHARLEAFSDGVFAIALTLLVLDIKIPASTAPETTGDLWRALGRLAPTLFAFLLSFVIVLITWVNHHNGMRLVNKSSHAFLYANGLLLLTVVFIPFPTALLGEYVLTDRAAPAVVLYSAVCAAQAIAWNVFTRVTLKPRPLTPDGNATETIRANHRYSYYAFVLYTGLAIAAFWFPLTVAVAITLSWLCWLVVGIRV
jgi:uncharacterized membrane protein